MGSYLLVRNLWKYSTKKYTAPKIYQYIDKLFKSSTKTGFRNDNGSVAAEPKLIFYKVGYDKSFYLVGDYHIYQCISVHLVAPNFSSPPSATNSEPSTP